MATFMRKPERQSSPLMNLTEAVAGGGVSLSRIVPVPVPDASVAPVGLESTTRNVSELSAIASPRTATVIVLLVSPAAKLTVPEAAV